MLHRAKVPGGISSSISQVNRNRQKYVSIRITITVRIIDSKFGAMLNKGDEAQEAFQEKF